MMTRAAIDGDSEADRRRPPSPALRAVARRACVRIGRDSSPSEDVVQELFARASNELLLARPIVFLIMTTAQNKRVDARRRGNRPSPFDDLGILPAEDNEGPADRHDLDRRIGDLGGRRRDFRLWLAVENRFVEETASRLDASEAATPAVALRRIARLAAQQHRGDAR